MTICSLRRVPQACKRRRHSRLSPVSDHLDAAKAKGYLNLREKNNGEIREEHIVDITISGRHLEITPAIRQYAEEKVSKLPKFYDLVQIVEVILDGHEAKRTRAEIV